MLSPHGRELYEQMRKMANGQVEKVLEGSIPTSDFSVSAGVVKEDLGKAIDLINSIRPKYRVFLVNPATYKKINKAYGNAFAVTCVVEQNINVPEDQMFEIIDNNLKIEILEKHGITADMHKLVREEIPITCKMEKGFL